MRISDWSSDVCSSDLQFRHRGNVVDQAYPLPTAPDIAPRRLAFRQLADTRRGWKILRIQAHPAQGALEPARRHAFHSRRIDDIGATALNPHGLVVLGRHCLLHGDEPGPDIVQVRAKNLAPSDDLAG